METNGPAFTDVFNVKVKLDPTNNNDEVEAGYKPTIVTQTMSVRELWREYLNETSLHGCKHALWRRHRKWASLLWILIVLGMAGSLMTVLVQLFLDYKQYPFRTVMSVRQERNITLPTFTLCLPSNIDMSKLKASPLLYDYISKKRSPLPLSSFFDTKAEMDDFLNRTKEHLSNMTLTDFEEKSAFSLEDSVLFMVMDNEYKFGPGLKSLLTPIFHPMQSCWELNGDIARPKSVSMFEEIILVVNLHTGTYPPNVPHSALEIFAHEIHASHLFQTSLYVRPGTFAKVEFSTTEHRYLPLPYRSFGDEGCLDVDSEEFQNPLKTVPKYDIMSCMMEFMVERMVAECGCTDYQYMDIFPNMPLCSFGDIEECYSPLYSQFYTEFFIQNRFSDVGCLPECSFTSYDLSLSAATFPSSNARSFLKLVHSFHTMEEARENLVYLRLKAKGASVQVIEHVPEITLLSIFGTVGGFMGLFLGASLLSLLELGETILFTLWLLIAKVKSFARRNEHGPSHKC